MRVLKIVCFCLIFSPKIIFSVPSPVTDIKCYPQFRSIKLTWSAPYDNSASTTPSWYHIAYSTYFVISSTTVFWNSIPSQNRLSFSTNTVKGAQETKVITGLMNNVAYNFAVLSSTDNINWSDINNISDPQFIIPVNTQPNPVPIFEGWCSPFHNVVTTYTPRFEWKPPTPGSDDALYGDYISKYTLYYATFNFNPSTDLVTSVERTTNYYQLSEPLKENKKYYWAVKAYDSESIPSSLSNVEYFYIDVIQEPPAPVTPLLPPDSSVVYNKKPVFDWTESSDPDPMDGLTYTLMISTIGPDIGFSTQTYGLKFSSYQPTTDLNLTENNTCWWYVVVVDSDNKTSENSYVYRFILNMLNESPTGFFPVYPVSGTLVHNSYINFDWNDGYDPDPEDYIDHYELIFSTVPDISNDIQPFPYYGKLTVKNLSEATTGPLLEDTTYYWKLFAYDKYSSWSDQPVQMFIVDSINILPTTFSLLTPELNITTTTLKPVFDWTDSFDTDPKSYVNYTIFYSSDNFKTYISSSGLTTSYFVPEQNLVDNTIYWWKVTAYDNRYSETMSTTYMFIINISTDPPVNFNLIYPTDNSVKSFQKIEFCWQDSYDPDPLLNDITYTLIYSTDQNFSTKSEVTGLIVSSYTAGPFLPYTTYYWKVKAISVDSEIESNQINWKIITTDFLPSTFSLISPSNNLTTSYLNVSFIWENSSDPDPNEIVNYILIYSTDPTFNYKTEITNIYTTNYTLTLSNNLTYYWKIKAKGGIYGYDEIESNQVNWKLYTVNPYPSDFNLINPINRIIISTNYPTFSWTQSVDPESEPVSYTIVYSSDNFDTYFTSSNIVNTTFTAIVPLTENALYKWYVISTDPWGNKVFSDTKQINQFYINTVRELPTKPVLISPQQGFTDDEILLIWSVSSDPDPDSLLKYTVWYSTDPYFNIKEEINELTTNQYFITGLLYGQSTYYWKIKVYDINDNPGMEIWSDTKTFSTPVSEPSEPTNIIAEISTDGTELNLKWDPVTYNTDGTICDNLIGYRIYRLKSLTDTDTYLVQVGSSVTSYRDISIDRRSFYYIVKSINKVSIESKNKFSVFIDANQKINNISQSDPENEFILNIPSEIYYSNNIVSNIIRLTNEETGNIYRVFEFKSVNSLTGTELKSFDKYIEIAFSYKIIPEQFITNYKIDNFRQTDIPNIGVSYFDGVEWQKLPVIKDNIRKLFIVKTNFTGKFRIEQISQKQDGFSLLNWPPKTKIITPNNDNKNDCIKFYFVNPYNELITGKIFDLSGKYVCDMKIDNVENSIMWDGRNNDNFVVDPGPYIYNIKIKDKIINGSIIVAR